MPAKHYFLNVVVPKVQVLLERIQTLPPTWSDEVGKFSFALNHVTVIVLKKDKEKKSFSHPHSARLEDLMKKVAGWLGCAVSSLKLNFEGEILRKNDTMDDLDVDPGDIIQVEFSGKIPDCGEQAGFELVSYLVELQHALESSMSSFTGGAIPALFRDSANQLSADFSLEDDGLEVVERAPQNNVVALT